MQDIYPDGDVQYLPRGLLRGIDEARSTPRHLWRPYDKPEPLTPGQVYDVRLTLPPVGALLRKGDKLQVALLAPSAVGQPTGGCRHSPAGPQYGLCFDDVPIEDPRPRYPRRQSPRPEPACGSLPFQPCRKAGPAGD